MRSLPEQFVAFLCALTAPSAVGALASGQVFEKHDLFTPLSSDHDHQVRVAENIIREADGVRHAGTRGVDVGE